MKKTLLAIALLGLTHSAWAHVSYSGRNFGTFSGLADASNTISNQAVTGNYGWADAASGNLGDSHHARAFRFTLSNDAWVSFSVAANPTATTQSVGGLLPGFSIYAGLAAVAPFTAPQTSADYDFNAASEAWRTSWAQAHLGAGTDFNNTDGSWNALGDWKMGGDGDPAGIDSALSSFVYVGSASSVTNTASGRFLLHAGNYSIFVGGNDLSNLLSADAGKAYGMTATLTVSAVPEPENMALLMAGLSMLGWQVRRRQNPHQTLSK